MIAPPSGDLNHPLAILVAIACHDDLSAADLIDLVAPTGQTATAEVWFFGASVLLIAALRLANRLVLRK